MTSSTRPGRGLTGSTRPYAAGGVERINDEQAATIRDMLESTGSNVKAFLGWLKVASVEDIPAKAYSYALSALKAKEKKA